MKRIIILLVACLTSGMILANHWTPIPEGWYSQSTTIRGVILINGVEQYSNQLELGIFCGDECRGSAIAADFFITHRYIADVNVYGENGHQLSFRLYDHSQGAELQLTPPESLVFSEDGYGEWLDPCVFNFTSSSVEISAMVNPENAGEVTGIGEYLVGATCTLTATANNGYVFANWTENGEVVSLEPSYTFIVGGERNLLANFETSQITNHWTPIPEGWYSQSTTIRGVILINGVEQFSDKLELGIFCGDECRGSAIAADFFITHRYIADVNVYGENGHQLNFKLYDHRQGKELELTPPESLVFTEDGYGEWLAPCEFNFTNAVSQTTLLTQGWNWWAPIVVTSIEAVETALGTALVTILSEQGPASGEATAGAMYRIQTNSFCTLSLNGMAMGSATITIEPGNNWFGYTGTQPTAIEEAISIIATEGDKIVSQDEGFAIYTTHGWQGTLGHLHPGCGYLYISTSNETRILSISSGN